MNSGKSKHIMISGVYAISIFCLLSIGCALAQTDKTKVRTKESRDDATETKEKTLVGRWKSDVATVEIRNNGKMTINGQVFNYRVNGSTLNVSNNEGTEEFPFQLDEDTLTVKVQGRSVVYKRMSGKETDQQDSETVNNPPELVGKWCYLANVQANDGGMMTNRCVILYANGIYQYNAETSSSNPYGGTDSQRNDSGRWSATSNSLTVYSNGGSKTYNLEKRNHPKNGDPMLIIDGDAYVTQTQKRPW